MERNNQPPVNEQHLSLCPPPTPILHGDWKHLLRQAMSSNPPPPVMTHTPTSASTWHPHLSNTDNIQYIQINPMDVKVNVRTFRGRQTQSTCAVQVSHTNTYSHKPGTDTVLSTSSNLFNCRSAPCIFYSSDLLYLLAARSKWSTPHQKAARDDEGGRWYGSSQKSSNHTAINRLMSVFSPVARQTQLLHHTLTSCSLCLSRTPRLIITPQSCASAQPEND